MQALVVRVVSRASSMAAAAALECPVCLSMPEGEVHQCQEGHCYCVECWNRLGAGTAADPRRCPQCRQPVPLTNRNRAAERAIAALEASCEHCDKITTRGAMAAHLAACPKLPTAGAAPADGFAGADGWFAAGGWLAAGGRLVRGLLRRRSSALCRRMMAPLQAECQELRAQNQQLHSQNMQLEGPRARRKELQAYTAIGLGLSYRRPTSSCFLISVTRLVSRVIPDDASGSS